MCQRPSAMDQDLAGSNWLPLLLLLLLLLLHWTPKNSNYSSNSLSPPDLVSRQSNGKPAWKTWVLKVWPWWKEGSRQTAATQITKCIGERIALHDQHFSTVEMWRSWARQYQPFPDTRYPPTLHLADVGPSLFEACRDRVKAWLARAQWHAVPFMSDMTSGIPSEDRTATSLSGYVTRWLLNILSFLQLDTHISVQDIRKEESFVWFIFLFMYIFHNTINVRYHQVRNICHHQLFKN